MEDIPYFPPTPKENIDIFSPEVLNNLEYILKDVLTGDPSAQMRPEYQGLNINQVKVALEYILSNSNLSDKEKNDLLTNSWRVNYRSRPPTPEEFLTEKYLGPVAPTIYPHIRKAFIEFLDPTKPYRTCVLYSHIGWGKSYLAVLVNIYIGLHLSLMKDPWKFFGLSPATVLTQVFCAESLKKSSELLFEPMLNVLESSTYFEKVHTREAMIQRDREFDRTDAIEKLFWTTAVPTSELQFSNGANFKLISKPGG